MFVDLDFLFREGRSVFFRVTGPFHAASWPRDVSRAATNVIEVMGDGSCQPRELYGSLIEVFSKDRELIIDIGSMQMVSSIITLSFSMTGRWFTCVHDPFHSVFLSFLGVGGGFRTHEMHLSLCLAIDVIEFLIILESSIYHNQSDFNSHI